MTLQFEEVLSDRFRMVFSIRMAQDLWGFMGISWIYPQMNGWCSSWRDLGLLNFDTNPSSLFRKPWVFFNGGSTRSLIDFWLDCSTSIDSMGYSYIYIQYIYSLDLCVGGVWLHFSYIFKVGQFHGIFIGSVCWLPCWGLTEFLLGESASSFPFPHWLSLLDPQNGPYFQQVDSVGFIDVYRFTLHFPAPFSKKNLHFLEMSIASAILFHRCP